MEVKKAESDNLFDSLKSIEPPRKVELEDEGETAGVGGSFSERADESPNLTDVQSALKVLLPKLKGYLNVMQVSRVFPDVYNALLELLVIDLLETYPEMGVVEAIATANTALSIAIDGEGRIDIIALYGKSSESEMKNDSMVGFK